MSCGVWATPKGEPIPSQRYLFPQDFKDIKEQYLFDVKSIVLMEDIPQEMIINWDQVGMKIVPSSA